LPPSGSEEQANIAKALSFTVVKTGDYGPTMVSVKVKITNTSGRHIRSAQATCILRRANGEVVSFKRHYVVKALKGGLAPGASTYFEYVIDANPKEVSHAVFQTDTVKWQ